MLMMAAFELGNPMMRFVLMITDDAPIHGEPPGLVAQRLASYSSDAFDDADVTLGTVA